MAFEGVTAASQVFSGGAVNQSVNTNNDTSASATDLSFSGSVPKVPTPAITGKNASVPYVNNLVQEHKNKTKPLLDEAYSEVDDIEQQAKNRNPTDLNPLQNNNFAMDGRYGNLNGKSYANTLKLSREADAYNNKPDTQIFHMGVNGAGPSEVTTVSKPKIETQEMRQMRANERLDEKQRGTDIDLQAAINKKDYDAFKAAIEQKYNLQLTTAQARQEMLNFAQQERIKTILDKDKAYFQQQLAFSFGMQKARMLLGMVDSGQNPATTMILARMLGIDIGDMSSLSQQMAITELAHQLYTNGECGSMVEANQKAQDLLTRQYSKAYSKTNFGG